MSPGILDKGVKFSFKSDRGIVSSSSAWKAVFLFIVHWYGCPYLLNFISSILLTLAFDTMYVWCSLKVSSNAAMSLPKIVATIFCS